MLDVVLFRMYAARARELDDVRVNGTWGVGRVGTPQGHRDHASVTLPGVLQTNVGHIHLDMCNYKKIISSDITAFEPGTLANLLVEHVDRN